MKENNLITGSITKKLVAFTMPIVFALLLQVMYGSVDMLIVGNFGTVADVSGVSTGSQMLNTITSLCTGLAMGITILIGQKIGEEKKEEVGSIIGNSTIVFFILSIVLTVILIAFPEFIMEMMNVPKDALIETKEYLFYCSIGIPMIYAYNVLGSIFRGLGDSKTPLMAVGIACVVNIIVDLVLVAGFNMGAGGAAIATVLAQTVSVVASLYIVKKRNILGFKMEKSDFSRNNTIIKDIFKLGSPIALQSVLVSISFLVITIIINKFGVIFSASVGVVEKITGIIMLIPLAFMQSMAVFVAQNYSAKEYHRAKKGMYIGMGISMIFGVVMGCIAVFHGEFLIGIFNNEIEIVEVAKTYLKAYALDTVLVPIMFCLTGYLSGRGKTLFVMIQALIGAVLIRIPLTYILSNIGEISLFRVGLATPIATFIQIIISIIFYIYIEKKEQK